MNYCKLIAIGNLTRDPETRQAGAGEVCNFSLAVNHKGAGGKDETLYLKVEAWNKLGALCQRYLAKGSEALVEGRLRQSTYTDRAGNERTQYSLLADAVRFGSRRKDQQGTEQAHDAPPVASEEGEEDLPF